MGRLGDPVQTISDGEQYFLVDILENGMVKATKDVHYSRFEDGDEEKQEFKLPDEDPSDMILLEARNLRPGMFSESKPFKILFAFSFNSKTW